MTSNYKPGDVANGHVLGEDNQWHPVAAGAAISQAATSAASPKGNWFARHKIISGVGGAVLLIAVINGVTGGEDTPESAVAATPSATSTTPVAKASSTPKAAAPTPTKAAEPAKPEMTKTQSNAVRSAENYISLLGMSKKGLIRQLSSKAGDGYSVADATFAANNVKADWNKEAIEAAENYQSIMPMSRSGLIRQLSSSAGDGFTAAEAGQAADAVGL